MKAQTAMKSMKGMKKKTINMKSMKTRSMKAALKKNMKKTATNSRNAGKRTETKEKWNEEWISIDTKNISECLVQVWIEKNKRSKGAEASAWKIHWKVFKVGKMQTTNMKAEADMKDTKD
jgi:hypothetical protein